MIVAAIALKLAGMVLLFDPAALQAFDLPKSLFSRALAAVLVALVGIALVRFGPAIVPRTKLHLFVLAVLLANAVSTLVAENRYVALFGDLRYLGMTFLADMALLYLAAAIAMRSPADWYLLGGFLAVAVTASIAYAAAQYLAVDPLTWERPPWPEERRPFGTQGNPDILGHLLSIALGAGLAATVLLPRAAAAPRLAAAMLTGLVLVAMGFVATRGSLLGVLGAALALGVVLVRQQGLSRPTAIRFAILTALLTALLGAILAATPLGPRALATLQGQGTERVLIYASALRATLDRPLFGHGPDNFGVVYPRYRQPGAFGPRLKNDSAHNWVLQATATTGLVGALAVVALIAAVGYTLATRTIPRSPLVGGALTVAYGAYWAHGLVSVGSVSVDWLPWLAAGGAAALATEDAPVPEARRLPAFLTLSLLAVSGAVALSGANAWRANRDAAVANSAWERGQTTVAVAAAESALRLDPGRAEYWNLLGLARTVTGEWRKASEAFREAAARYALDAAYGANFGRSRVKEAVSAGDDAGARAAALEAARRAVAADPMNPFAQTALAEVALALGEANEALEAAVRAISLQPLEREHLRLAAAAALRASRPSVARDTLQRALSHGDSAILRLALAQLSLRLNDLAQARAHARRALELEPDSEEARRAVQLLGGE